MKDVNWGKVAKTVGIIAIIALVILYFDNRRVKRENIQWNRVSDLSYVSEELSSLKEYCSDAIKYEGYEDLCVSMYHVQEKCEELQRLVDEACDYFTPKEPDIDSSRSSF
jgi:hypothetical protein